MIEAKWSHKIFGVALVLVMMGSMLGGLVSVSNGITNTTSVYASSTYSAGTHMVTFYSTASDGDIYQSKPAFYDGWCHHNTAYSAAWGVSR
jgi:hypothetical protein